MTPPLTCKPLLPPEPLPLLEPLLLPLPELLPLLEPLLPPLPLPELLPLLEPLPLPPLELLLAPPSPPPSAAVLFEDDEEHAVKNDATAAPERSTRATPNGWIFTGAKYHGARRAVRPPRLV
jgi:hypothetical protein